MSNKSGWTDCTPLEAHKAFVAGTHEVQVTAINGGWIVCDDAFYESPKWKYRIREKVKAITVEIPKPNLTHLGDLDHSTWLGLMFPSTAQRDTALAAIKVAMEKV